MDNMWITAMVPFLDAAGWMVDMPGPARNLANHLGAIVAAVTGQAPGPLRETSVRCRRRPGRPPCVGRIRAVVEVGSGEIAWHCPACPRRPLVDCHCPQEPAAILAPALVPTRPQGIHDYSARRRPRLRRTCTPR